MSSEDYVDGGGTADDPMVVGDSDEEVQANDASKKNSGDTQETQARPTGTENTVQGAPKISSDDQPVRPTSNTPALASNDQRETWRPHLPDAAAPNPPYTSSSNTQATTAVSDSSAAASSNTQTATIAPAPTTAAANNTQTATPPGTFIGGHVSVIVGTVPVYSTTNTSTATNTGTQASVPFVAGVPPPGPYPAGPVHQRTKHQGEVFTLHPTDPAKLIARFRIENPFEPGTYYEQVDEIPEMDKTVSSPDDPEFIYLPNLENAKIPNKHRRNRHNNYTPHLWTRQPGTMVWTRPGLGRNPVERWSPIIVFRRFNFHTKKYEDIHISLKKLENVDPNDDHNYHHPYNKWLDQMKRRRDRDYVKRTSKDHWSVAERRAMYAALNNFVRQYGLHKFGFKGVKMTNGQMKQVADAVNSVGDKDRQPDAVRSQINSSHQKKNKAVADLMLRADAIRKRLDRGEVIPREELYLTEALSEDLFPVEPFKKVVATYGPTETTQRTDTASTTETQQREDSATTTSTEKRTDTANTKKRPAATLEEDTDTLSDPPSDLDTPVQLRARRPSLSLLPSSPRTSIRPNKKPRYSDLSNNQLPSTTSWTSTASSSHSQPAHDANDAWETTDDEALDPKTVAKRKVARDRQQVIMNSLRRGPPTESVGVAVPGEVESDSDEPLAKKVERKKAGEEKKRKRTTGTAVPGESDGDDEEYEEMKPKKVRRGGRK